MPDNDSAKLFASNFLEPVDATIEGVPVTVSFAVDDGRVRITFPQGKPSASVRDVMKGQHMKWAPGAGAWQCPASRAEEVLAAVLDR